MTPPRCCGPCVPMAVRGSGTGSIVDFGAPDRFTIPRPCDGVDRARTRSTGAVTGHGGQRQPVLVPAAKSPWTPPTKNGRLCRTGGEAGHGPAPSGRPPSGKPLAVSRRNPVAPSIRRKRPAEVFQRQDLLLSTPCLAAPVFVGAVPVAATVGRRHGCPSQNVRTISTRRCRSSVGAYAGSRRNSPKPVGRNRLPATPC